ncbi:MAG: bifunctional (p)ppGpp synthetase/guanosine-3',5'-bis(diphosphate) 3'-pyrophosphohydrolase [Firmicutes bacterium]|nr:bifunctional (p)ppGpp synthetase/guanosine-3',5'-bis(diphosphate) 3'-pyrophosphohydrolase [Bacillota bacterium]
MEKRQEFLEGLQELNPTYDLELIGRAYDLAGKMHQGQLRKSGEPYLIHPIAVAKILAELGMDEETICAGLLHDVVEDTEYTNEDLRADFGDEIELLVDGVTKLGSFKYESKEERQAENLRKMFLAMSKDIRVLVIKLADRLHNLRTINYMSQQKIQEKCMETLEIYAPLAARLGIYSIKFELEDIALKYTDPDAYYDLAEQVSAKKTQRDDTIKHVIGEIEEALEELNIKYEIKGRSKHFYSIYRKMKLQNKQLDEIFDLTAVRIIVETIKDCYAVLGIVHTLWKPIPGKFKDYIAMPKPNMYQSLHTTVIGDHGDPFEIQIRTYDMHQVAEYGIAAHWKYKEGKTKGKSDNEEIKLAWLRQTLEWQKDMNDPKEFMETLKVDLFTSQVYVFTPNGEIMELPVDSTPLDFAFKIHSAVGYKCVGAKVDGKMVPIDTKLKNGNIVEIITSNNSRGPSADWLKIAKSSSARNKIRQWLKKENQPETIENGKSALEKYVKKHHYDPKEVMKNSYIQKAYKQLNFQTPEEMFIQVATGGSTVGKVANVLIGYYNTDNKPAEVKKEDSDIVSVIESVASEKVRKPLTQKKDTSGVTVKGVDNLLIRMAKCCNPVPGDEIIGFVAKGRGGISVHRADCVNIVSIPDEDKGRLIEVEWDFEKLDKAYSVDIYIIADDRKGLFADISKICEDMDVNITGVNGKTLRDGSFSMNMSLAVNNSSQMQKLLRSLKNVQGVTDVHRTSL